MEKFKITFWKVQFNEDNSFIKKAESFLVTANITKSTEETTEIYQVKLNDIGLNSLFGEFEIVRQNNLWQTSDQDSKELNLLKMNIIEVLNNQLK